jgi:hypothetical protein
MTSSFIEKWLLRWKTRPPRTLGLETLREEKMITLIQRSTKKLMGRAFRVVSVGKTMLKLGLLINTRASNNVPWKKIRKKKNLGKR